MRTILAAIALLIACSSMNTASAVEYPWCAQYSNSHGGSNCGFVSLQQCMAAISGNGGSCRENGFYAAAVKASPRTRKPRRADR